MFYCVTKRLVGGSFDIEDRDSAPKGFGCLDIDLLYLLGSLAAGDLNRGEANTTEGSKTSLSVWYDLYRIC